MTTTTLKHDLELWLWTLADLYSRPQLDPDQERVVLDAIREHAQAWAQGV